MTDRMIYRYEVPVDDQWHDVSLAGSVLHVAARKFRDEVEVWAYHQPGTPARIVQMRVFGTGQPIPPGVAYVGTALVDELAWHLMEAVQPDDVARRAAADPREGAHVDPDDLERAHTEQLSGVPPQVEDAERG